MEPIFHTRAKRRRVRVLTTIYYINNVLQRTFLFFCHIITLELTHDKNAALLATEPQLTPTSLQGEPQMSKCVITVVCSNAHIHSVVFGGICIFHL